MVTMCERTTKLYLTYYCDGSFSNYVKGRLARPFSAIRYFSGNTVSHRFQCVRVVSYENPILRLAHFTTHNLPHDMAFHNFDSKLRAHI